VLYLQAFYQARKRNHLFAEFRDLDFNSMNDERLNALKAAITQEGFVQDEDIERCIELDITVNYLQNTSTSSS
jgi:hypothetical protein